MAKYKITVDHEKCICCGACEQNCDNFKLKDGKSNHINPEVDEFGCNQEVAYDCPVSAINVEEI